MRDMKGTITSEKGTAYPSGAHDCYPTVIFLRIAQFFIFLCSVLCIIVCPMASGYSSRTVLSYSLFIDFRFSHSHTVELSIGILDF